MADSNRRRLTNITVDSAALVRLSVPFFMLLIASLVTIKLVDWQMADAISQLEFTTTEGALNFSKIVNAHTTATYIAMGGITMLGCFSFGMWLMLSHRLFGPTVPIRRHIARLRAGDYGSRIKLRKRDEFKIIAEELNLLAETLQERETISHRKARVP